MISETTLVGCENVPPEMACRFDEAWVFVGEVQDGNRYAHRAICRKCTVIPDYSRWPVFDRAQVVYQEVDLKGYLFITDDMIECMVYFGVCRKCDMVHWSRQGPPFQRARCLVPV